MTLEAEKIKIFMKKMKTIITIILFYLSTALYSQPPCFCLMDYECVPQSNCGEANEIICVSNGGIWFKGGGSLTNCNLTLPISLSYFYVDNANENNHITWETLSEINNDYFIVYRSIDNVSWTHVTKIQGAGNSSINIKYEYIDDDYYKNTINYYKLVQVDFDGKQEEFNIVSVDNKEVVRMPVKYIDFFGHEIQDIENYNGIIIVLYSDGYTEKRVVVN